MFKLKYILLFPALLLLSCASNPTQPTQSVKETIPLTMANVRGHEQMYREGWFVVSSSENAIKYAKKHAVHSAVAALDKAKTKIVSRSAKLPGELHKNMRSGVELGSATFQSGSTQTKRIFSTTEDIADREKRAAISLGTAAYSRFVLGYLTLGQRTNQDVRNLQSLPGGYFKTLKSDLTNLNHLTKKATEKLRPTVESAWPSALEKGQIAFEKGYEDSGKQTNSLAGLTDLAKGYWGALYYGIISPSASSIKSVGANTGVLAGKTIVLPVSALFIVSGRTVQSLGLSLWYTTRLGYKLVSPTVEGGLLAGMSLLSTAAIPATVTAGTAAGVINQVVVSTSAPVVAGAASTIKTSSSVAQYSAALVYDISTAALRVSIEELSTGIVLGYNAITALPAQTVLGVTSGVFFLAWDGPRLVIAYAKGEINAENKQVNIEDLPVGTVLDLQKLRQEDDIQLQIISEDEATVQQVLENAPLDMQEKE